MKKNVLPFEKPVVELREKIAELKKISGDSEVDLSAEIDRLEERLEHLEREVYENMAPWDRVQMARHAERPTTLDYIEQLFTDFLEMHGDRYHSDDEAIVGGIAKFNGQPVTVVGHQRGKDTKENIRRNFGMPHPEGYRKALRLMYQAEKFNRPIITFIDTKVLIQERLPKSEGKVKPLRKTFVKWRG